MAPHINWRACFKFSSKSFRHIDATTLTFLTRINDKGNATNLAITNGFYLLFMPHILRIIQYRFTYAQLYTYTMK